MTISDDHRREMLMKKRILGILFSFALMMAMLPVLGVSQTAYAESYNLWIGNDEVTTDKTTGDGWSYDANSNTLTLTNATIENGHSISGDPAGVLYTGSETLNVVLVGDNNIKAPQGSYKLTYGIYSANGITISGDGSLSTDVSNDGIYATSVTIKSGTIDASGNTGINVSSTGTVSIEGGSVTLIQCIDGIFCKDLSISGGTVNISQAGEAFEVSQDVKISGGSVTVSGATAIRAGRNIELSGGSVEASGTVAGLKTSGEDIKISGGTVKASATGTNGNAINSSRHVDIEGGTVEATGGDVAILASGQVKLTGGSVTASGTTKGIDNGASYNMIIGSSVRVWAGDDKDKANDVTQTFATNHNYKWVQTETATLWVGGIPVTSRNAENILGDAGVSASYDYDKKTLTLNNYSYESDGYKYVNDPGLPDQYAAIYADQELNIRLEGDNTVKCTKKDNSIGNGIHVAGEDGDLIITGNGTLTASAYGNGQDEAGVGIYARDGDIEFNGSTVNALGDTGIGISTDKKDGYVRINSGIVTASGSDRGFSGSHITAADDLGINAGDSKETAIYVDKGSFDDDHRQQWVQISEAYPLWVRGTLVMVANKDDVLGDGKVSFDPKTNTLKLNGADIKADSRHQYNNAAIYYGDNKNELIINAVKASTVTGPESTDISANGISSAGPLTVRGKLTVSGGKGDAGYGILAPALTVDKNAELTAAGVNGIDILEKGSVAVKGKLTSTGTETGIFIDNGEITVSSGAELNVTGNKVAGIGSTGDSFLVVNEGAKVNAVGGLNGAIDAIVKNAITGTAWTDKTGAEGETPIETDTNGRVLDAKYKKVQFPAAQYTITYDLNGGTLDGQTGIVTKKADAGETITLPAPKRDGYTFDYWQGSKYKAGEKYTVNGDHTFKAVWKTAEGGDGSKGGSSKKGVSTGDENTLGAWIALLAAALTGTAGTVFARKRKGE